MPLGRDEALRQLRRMSLLLASSTRITLGQPSEDKKDIAVAQLRSLSEVLTLRSYRGGPKVALIDPAEAMNIHSFNALLKTLEEPPEETYLLLATSRSDRIPRTIASRCARFRMPLPETEEASLAAATACSKAGGGGAPRERRSFLAPIRCARPRRTRCG